MEGDRSQETQQSTVHSTGDMECPSIEAGKRQDSGCQRPGARERVTGENGPQREPEEGSGVRSLSPGHATQLVRFVSQLSAATSTSAGIQGTFPGGMGVFGLGTAYIPCPFPMRVLLAPLPRSRVSCGLVLRRMYEVIPMFSEEGRAPLVFIWFPHMDTLPFSSGPPWGLLPPKLAPQAEVMFYGSPLHSL